MRLGPTPLELRPNHSSEVYLFFLLKSVFILLFISILPSLNEEVFNYLFLCNSVIVIYSRGFGSFSL